MKKDTTYPLVYGSVLAALLLYRVWWAAERVRARRAPHSQAQAKPAA